MTSLFLAALTLGSVGTANSAGDPPSILNEDRVLPAVFRDVAPDFAASVSSALVFQDKDKDKDKDKDDESRQERGGGFAIGPVGGYLKTRGADRGTWLAGVQTRLYFLKFLAAEAAISFHQDKFNDGDTRVTQYPVQLSGMLFPFPRSPVQPYLLGGAGWYYTRIDNTGSLSAIPNETEHWFGGHAGGGVELAPSRTVSLFIDVRYIFIDPKTDIQNRRGDADFWQVTFGMGLGF